MSKISETMETGLQLQIEKSEAKLKHYRRDNEDLRDMYSTLEAIIEVHKMGEKCKEKKF